MNASTPAIPALATATHEPAAAAGALAGNKGPAGSPDFPAPAADAPAVQAAPTLREQAASSPTHEGALQGAAGLVFPAPDTSAHSAAVQQPTLSVRDMAFSARLEASMQAVHEPACPAPAKTAPAPAAQPAAATAGVAASATCEEHPQAGDEPAATSTPAQHGDLMAAISALQMAATAARGPAQEAALGAAPHAAHNPATCPALQGSLEIALADKQAAEQAKHGPIEDAHLEAVLQAARCPAKSLACQDDVDLLRRAAAEAAPAPKNEATHEASAQAAQAAHDVPAAYEPATSAAASATPTPGPMALSQPAPDATSMPAAATRGPVMWTASGPIGIPPAGAAPASVASAASRLAQDATSLPATPAASPSPGAAWTLAGIIPAPAPVQAPGAATSGQLSSTVGLAEPATRDANASPASEDATKPAAAAQAPASASPALAPRAPVLVSTPPASDSTVTAATNAAPSPGVPPAFWAAAFGPRSKILDHSTSAPASSAASGPADVGAPASPGCASAPLTDAASCALGGAEAGSLVDGSPLIGCSTSGTSSVIDRPPFTAFGPFGTRIGAFRKVQMEENPILSTGSPKVFLFNTLTAMPEYHAKSLDELRWEDYQAGFPAGLGTLALLAPQPGTRMVSFRKVQDPDYATLQSGRDVLLDFATITAMPEYQNTSLEELRWGDYQAGVKGSETAQQPTPWQTGSAPAATRVPVVFVPGPCPVHVHGAATGLAAPAASEAAFANPGSAPASSADFGTAISTVTNTPPGAPAFTAAAPGSLPAHSFATGTAASTPAALEVAPASALGSDTGGVSGSTPASSPGSAAAPEAVAMPADGPSAAAASTPTCASGTGAGSAAGVPVPAEDVSIAIRPLGTRAVACRKTLDYDTSSLQKDVQVPVQLITLIHCHAGVPRQVAGGAALGGLPGPAGSMWPSPATQTAAAGAASAAGPSETDASGPPLFTSASPEQAAGGNEPLPPALQAVLHHLARIEREHESNPASLLQLRDARAPVVRELSQGQPSHALVQGVHRVLEYACLHCLAAPLDLMLHYLPRHIFTDGGPVVDLTACLYCEPSPAGESNLRCDHSRNETARVLLSHGWHLHEDVTQQDSTAARPGGMNAAPTTQTPGKTTPEMEYFAAVQQQLGPAWWRHAASDLPPPLKPIVRLPLSRIGRAPAAQQAVTLITAHSMLSRPGPLVLAFSGPPGHGKTDMAWELARLMQEVPLSQADFLKVSCAAVRTADDLLRFNSQLNHFVAEHDGKHGVVLLAGFDKLEPQGQLGFLEAFDTGSWTASGAELQTATVDCSKLIFILTAVQAEPNAVLLSPESQKLGLPFAQEVIGRIADVVPFPAYTRKEKLLLVQHYLNKECRKWRTGAGLAAGQCAVEIAYDVGVVKGLLGRCCRLVDVTGVPEIALRVQFEVAQALVRQRLEAFGVSGQAGRLSDCA